MSASVTQKDALLTAAVMTAAGRPASEVATAVSKSERTIRRWRRRPSFRKVVSSLRSDLLGAAVGRLLNICGKAADALERNLTCDTAQGQIAAARSILLLTLRGLETAELADKIQALEQIVKRLTDDESGKQKAGQDAR